MKAITLTGPSGLPFALAVSRIICIESGNFTGTKVYLDTGESYLAQQTFSEVFSLWTGV